MEFLIYYTSSAKFDKDYFDFFEKNYIKYEEDKSYGTNDTMLLPDFDWSKIKCLYDNFKAIVIDHKYIIIYDDYIE